MARCLLLLAAGVALRLLSGCGGRLIGAAPATEGDAAVGPAGSASDVDGAVEPSPLGADASMGMPDGAPLLRDARPDARARRDAAAPTFARADAGLRDAACTWGLTEVAQHPDAGDTPSAIGTADFDGDGHLDLAVTGQGTGTANTSNVAILLGNGDGTFQPAVMYPTGEEDAYALAIGDLNSDGIPDLAVANVAHGVSILLGNDDGTFEPAAQYASEAVGEGVAIGDLNGDGIPDVALGSSRVVVLLGNGDGTLRESTTYAAGTQPYAVAIADFNHDGHADLVAAETGYQNMEVLLGNGDGTFQAPIASVAAVGPASVAVADLDGDGNLDVAVPGFSGMTTLLGSGDGTFHDRALPGGPAFQASTSIADLDGDGHLDLVTGNTEMGQITIALGDGKGGFQNTAEMLGIAFYGVTVGDFNEDGWPDVAAPDLHGSLYVLLGGCVP